MTTKDRLLNMLPRWKNGDKAGTVRGDAFVQFERVLNSYTLSENDLKLIEADINQAFADQVEEKKRVFFQARVRYG